MERIHGLKILSVRDKKKYSETMRKNIISLGKSLGKHVLPDAVVNEYRREMGEKAVSELEENILLIVFDACRYDSFKRAYSQEWPGELKEVYSPATWTLPSHESMLRGKLPFNEELRKKDIIKNNYPSPKPLPLQHPYSFGVTAVPILSSSPVLSGSIPKYFDDYYNAESCTSSEKVISKSKKKLDKLTQSQKPFFGLINLGETHYPYQKYNELSLKEFIEKLDVEITYDEVHAAQEAAAEHLISKVEELLPHVPDNTKIIITSDHGELLGEKSGYGHNPNRRAKFHKNLYRVPLISWKT